MNPCSTREYRFHALHTRLVYPAGPLLHKTDRVQRRTSRERNEADEERLKTTSVLDKL